MNFFVKTIENYSEKANRVDIKFINTNTIIDDCSIKIFVPKSIDLIPNEENNIPFYIAESIWTNYYCTTQHIKSLEKQVKLKAPKGKKIEWKKMVNSIFYDVRKLNEKEPDPEEVGNFVGIPGQNILTQIRVDKLLYTNEWQDIHRWTHTGYNWEHPSGTSCLWRLIDKNGEHLTYKTSSDNINERLNQLLKSQEYCVISGIVVRHEVFRGQRQTKLTRITFKK